MRALILIALLTTPAMAAPPRCVALKDGKRFGPITEMKVEKSTGRAVYCAHGDECYSADTVSIMSPCRFFKDPDFQEPGTWNFATD